MSKFAWVGIRGSWGLSPDGVGGSQGAWGLSPDGVGGAQGPRGLSPDGVWGGSGVVGTESRRGLGWLKGRGD